MLLSATAQNVSKKWTSEYRLDIYNRMMSSNDTDLSLLYRSQQCNCMIDKLQYIYPNGLPKDIPNGVAVKVSGDCAKIISNPLAWTKQFEDTIRNSLVQFRNVKALPIKGQGDLCDCIIREMEVRYPKGLPKNLPTKNFNDILTKCPVSKFNY